jgi:hypothetical protein
MFEANFTRRKFDPAFILPIKTLPFFAQKENPRL